MYEAFGREISVLQEDQSKHVNGLDQNYPTDSPVVLQNQFQVSQDEKIATWTIETKSLSLDIFKI